jgi:hypothetical protein
MVLRWVQGGRVVSQEESARVQDFDQGSFEIEVMQPVDTSITLALRLEEGQTS